MSDPAPYTKMVMKERANRIMAHLPYAVPGDGSGITIKALAFILNISRSQVRTSLVKLVASGKVRRVRVQWHRDEYDAKHWVTRYAIERK